MTAQEQDTALQILSPMTAEDLQLLSSAPIDGNGTTGAADYLSALQEMKAKGIDPQVMLARYQELDPEAQDALGRVLQDEETMEQMMDLAKDPNNLKLLSQMSETNFSIEACTAAMISNNTNVTGATLNLPVPMLLLSSVGGFILLITIFLICCCCCITLEAPHTSDLPRQNWLVLENVTYEVDNREGGGGLKLMKDVSCCFRTGEVAAILGPSGCGKTTLLNAISGRTEWNLGGGRGLSGKVYLNNDEVNDKVLQKIAGYVFQDDQLVATETVAEAVELCASLRASHLSPEERRDRVTKLLNELGLTICQDVRIGDAHTKGISGGQKRRTSAALEIVAQPLILLLDEPTSGLDSYTSVLFVKLLKHIAKSLNTIVVCTIHQPSLETFEEFDRTLIFKQGELMFHGHKTPKMPGPAVAVPVVTTPRAAAGGGGATVPEGTSSPQGTSTPQTTPRGGRHQRKRQQRLEGIGKFPQAEGEALPQAEGEAMFDAIIRSMKKQVGLAAAGSSDEDQETINTVAARTHIGGTGGAGAASSAQAPPPPQGLAGIGGNAATTQRAARTAVKSDPVRWTLRENLQACGFPTKDGENLAETCLMLTQTLSAERMAEVVEITREQGYDDEMRRMLTKNANISTAGQDNNRGNNTAARLAAIQNAVTAEESVLFPVHIGSQVGHLIAREWRTRVVRGWVGELFQVQGIITSNLLSFMIFWACREKTAERIVAEGGTGFMLAANYMRIVMGLKTCTCMFLVSPMLINALAEFTQYAGEQNVFTREYTSKMYHLPSYLIAKLFVEFFLICFRCAVHTAMVYLFFGLYGDWWMFFLLSVLLCFQGVSQMVLCIGMTADTLQAMSLASVVIGIQLVLSGQGDSFATDDSDRLAPGFVSGLQYLMGVYWAVKGMYRNQLQGMYRALTAFDETDGLNLLEATACSLKRDVRVTDVVAEAKGILREAAPDNLYNSAVFEIAVLFTSFVAYRILAGLLLKWRNRYAMH
ncbi:unnamed protein product [Amoebophrya sp. A120]|nr:unnamed protein product [Amoebophrya sp. A120]|eukprot:GSA120T00003079001.1